MTKLKFSLNYKDDDLLELVKKTDKKILAVWAIDCCFPIGVRLASTDRGSD